MACYGTNTPKIDRKIASNNQPYSRRSSRNLGEETRENARLTQGIDRAIIANEFHRDKKHQTYVCSHYW